MFLSHPKVPINVKSSISETVLFKTKFYNEEVHQQSININDVDKYFMLRNEENYFTIEDIVNHLMPLQNYSVIQFHSLYGNLLSEYLFNAFDREKLTGIKSLHYPNYRVVHFLNSVP